MKYKRMNVSKIANNISTRVITVPQQGVTVCKYNSCCTACASSHNIVSVNLPTCKKIVLIMVMTALTWTKYHGIDNI